MGMTVVRIDDETEAHVKDNAAYRDSWGLFVTLWRGGDIVASDEVRTADIDDETIEAAARGFAAGFDQPAVGTVDDELLEATARLITEDARNYGPSNLRASKAIRQMLRPQSSET